MLHLPLLTLDQLGDMTLDQLGTLIIQAWRATAVVPAGQVAEDLDGFLLLLALPLPAASVIASDESENRLPCDVRENTVVVRVDLKRNEDTVIVLEGQG